MDFDGLLIHFPRLRRDLDLVTAWIKRQDPTFGSDQPSDAERVAIANGESPEVVEDAKPVTRGEVRKILASMGEVFEGRLRDLGDRDQVFAERLEEVGALRRDFDAFRGPPPAVDPAVRQQTLDPQTLPQTAGRTTEQIDQGAKDGIVRAGSDLSDPSNADRPQGDAPNPSGAREAMSAEFQAPKPDASVGPNGMPTVEHASASQNLPQDASGGPDATLAPPKDADAPGGLDRPPGAPLG